MAWINLTIMLTVGCIFLIIGYSLGSRHSRRVKNQALTETNKQALELLDAKASLKKLRRYAAQQERKDKLLQLTLKKLQQSNVQCQHLQQRLEKLKRKYYFDLSHLRLKTVELHETAIKATNIARQTMAHLRHLEHASPVTQTIKAPKPKSYGAGEAVTVSVVDQPRLDAPSSVVTPVSNRDSARLTKLRSSNEARVQGM